MRARTNLSPWIGFTFTHRVRKSSVSARIRGREFWFICVSAREIFAACISFAATFKKPVRNNEIMAPALHRVP
jgi:hypothetical protein